MSFESLWLPGSLVINMGSDPDSVALFDVEVATNLKVAMGGGEGTIETDSLIVGANALLKNRGADGTTTAVAFSEVIGNLTIKTGVGDDIVDVEETVVGNKLKLLTGAETTRRRSSWRRR